MGCWGHETGNSDELLGTCLFPAPAVPSEVGGALLQQMVCPTGSWEKQAEGSCLVFS